MHDRVRPGPTRRFQPWIAAVGLLLVVGQLVPLLHLALVPHRLCALHGVEDVRHASGPLVVSRHPGHSGFRAAPAIQSSHDGCVLSSVLFERAATLTSTGAAAVALPDFRPGVCPVGDSALRPSRRPLALAPKQGPPA